MSTDLARKTTVSDLVAAYQATCATIRRTFAMLVEAELALNAVYSLGDELATVHIDAGRGRYDDAFDEPEVCIGRIRRQCWGAIVERLELRRMLSVERWTAMQAELTRGELPEITEESVAIFAQGYLDAMPQMLAESVREVFEWLRPRGQYDEPKFKRNSELEVPVTVVITGVVCLGWVCGFRVRSEWVSQRLTALENVFSALDGHGQINKRYKSEIEDAIGAAVDGRAATAYFSAKCYKNGNVHLTFRRPDLLARFNQIAGGARLRPVPRGETTSA